MARLRGWEVVFSPTGISKGHSRLGALFQQEGEAEFVQEVHFAFRRAHFLGKILELSSELRVAAKTRHGPKGGGECEEPQRTSFHYAREGGERAVRTEARMCAQPRTYSRHRREAKSLQIPCLALDYLLCVYCFGGLYVKRINFYLLPGTGLCFMACTYLKPLLSVLKWSKLPNTVQSYEHGPGRTATSIIGAA